MEIGLRAKSLPRFRILQIGDVHYPDWATAPAAIDVKTRQLSSDIMDSLQTDGFQNLLREISRNDFIDSCDSAVFVGDFTTRGDQDQLQRALRHLAGLFRINPHSQNPKFHLVPGNHDVSQDHARTLGMAGKFDPMARLAQELGFGPLPVLNPVALRPGDSNRPVMLLLTNTTLGSWEKVGLPEQVQAWIERVAAREYDDQDSSVASDEGSPVPLLNPSTYYDQLDTPFVSKRTLMAIQQAVDDDVENAIPCVIGHHNILPQAIPRVSPFGELLNQGEFRSTLLQMGRPVIYLHGHIHTDPVEIITSPNISGSKVVSISAPPLSEGANVIDIFFSRAGEPIGLSITPLRVGEDGHVHLAKQIDISIRSSGSAFISGRLADAVVQALVGGRQTWSELRNALALSDIDDDELEAICLELLWASAIKVINQTSPRQRWFLELDR